MARVPGRLGRKMTTERPYGLLGRLPGEIPVGVHELPHYVAGSLPVAPPEVKVPDVKGYLHADWGMLGNDRYGNCVAENSLVQCSDATRGYRSYYSGPMHTFVLASGKNLSVTPNHAVLTPRGFVQARFLKKGDYLIGASGLQGAKRAENFDFNNSPAPIQDVIEALGGPSTMSTTVDFHGDEVFCSGNIDVISAQRHLGYEIYSSLCQEQRQRQIVAAAQKQCFLRGNGTPFERERTGLRASFGSISRRGNSFALLGAHSRIDDGKIFANTTLMNTILSEQANESLIGDTVFFGEPECRFARDVTISSLLEDRIVHNALVVESGSRGVGLATRPSGFASFLQPTTYGSATDPHLPADLVHTFPGSIHLDSILDIKIEPYEGHVYDLSTMSGWYVTDGIVTHNCGVAGLEHGFMADAVICQERQGFPTTEQAVEYYLTYTSGQDSGVVLSKYLAYVREKGYYGDRVAAYAPVNPTDVATLRSATFLYDFLYCGIVVTASMQAAFARNEPWTTATVAGGIVGGHCIPIVGFDEHYLYAVTWGAVQAISYPAWLDIADEAWAVITHQLVRRGGNGRGIDLDALTADLDRLR